MDYNTDGSLTPKRSPKLSSLRLPSIRNIFKLSKNQSDLDVPTLLHDIDVLLESKNVEEGHALLRGMVADLLKEIDLLRFRLNEVSSNLDIVKEERDVVNNDYRDRIANLVLALQQHGVNTDLKEKCKNGSILSADEATALTIQTLTQKIEALNIANTQQNDKLQEYREKIEDLESERESQILKVGALERQFKSINTKRNKVAKNFTNIPGAPGTPTIKSVKKFPEVKTITPLTSKRAKLVKLVDPSI